MTEMDTFRQELDLFDRYPTPPENRVKVPIKGIITSLIGLGPIPISEVINTITMVNEGNRIPPGGASLTPAETTTRSGPVKRAIAHIKKICKGEAKTLIEQIKSVFARINILTDIIAQLEEDPIVGANGEQLTTAEAVDQHDTLRDQVNHDLANGSVKHLVRRGHHKATELGLLLLDFPVFFLAMCSVFNVSFRLLFTGDIPTVILGITAALFALMGTLLYGYTMRFLGRRHRAFKNDQGSITATGTTRTTLRLEQGLALTVTVLVAAVMATRIWIEGANAEAPVALIVALAGLFAALLGLSGYINYTSEYSNGSDTIDRIQHLSAQLHHRVTSLDQLNNQRTLLIEEAGIKIAKLKHLITRTLDQATHQITTSTADKAITLARSYRAITTPVPAPEITSPTLELTLIQATELTDHHRILKEQHA